MRRALIQHVLPAAFSIIPLMAAVVVVLAIPRMAFEFYVERIHDSPIDWLILGLGLVLFVLQLHLCWRALRWQGSHFDERPDPWITHLAQAAEWFPLLGLIGTVAGIMQTFSQITGRVPPEQIIRLYAPAITATGSGLFMALINILPSWIVLMGRDLILSLGGGEDRP